MNEEANRQSPYGTLMWQMEVSKEVGLESNQAKVKTKKK